MERKSSNVKPDVNWGCCSGGKIDSRLLTYLVQVSFALITLIFCMYKLVIQDDENDNAVWVSLLSAIIGNFMPNVAHYKSNQDSKDV